MPKVAKIQGDGLIATIGGRSAVVRPGEVLEGWQLLTIGDMSGIQTAVFENTLPTGERLPMLRSNEASSLTSQNTLEIFPEFVPALPTPLTEFGLSVPLNIFPDQTYQACTF